jgi:hypothetical protein
MLVLYTQRVFWYIGTVRAVVVFVWTSALVAVLYVHHPSQRTRCLQGCTMLYTGHRVVISELTVPPCFLKKRVFFTTKEKS